MDRSRSPSVSKFYDEEEENRKLEQQQQNTNDENATEGVTHQQRVVIEQPSSVNPPPSAASSVYLWVRNVDRYVHTEHLTKILNYFADVVVVLRPVEWSGVVKEDMYVEMKSPEGAAVAREKMDRGHINGREVRVLSITREQYEKHSNPMKKQHYIQTSVATTPMTTSDGASPPSFGALKHNNTAKGAKQKGSGGKYSGVWRKGGAAPTTAPTADISEDVARREVSPKSGGSRGRERDLSNSPKRRCARSPSFHRNSEE
eukprot:PhF_6_TR25789/c0_g1_i4/m.36378